MCPPTTTHRDVTGASRSWADPQAAPAPLGLLFPRNFAPGLASSHTAAECAQPDTSHSKKHTQDNQRQGRLFCVKARTRFEATQRAARGGAPLSQAVMAALVMVVSGWRPIEGRDS